jgi:hypothetical protein
MVDFNKNGNGDAQKPRGQGESPRGESGLTPAQEARLIATALNPRKRFRLSRKVKAEMVEASCGHMHDPDPRVGVRGVANLLAMERQNQADEHKAIDKVLPTESGTTNQQINIYLPANGREETGGHLTNGNGRH